MFRLERDIQRLKDIALRTRQRVFTMIVEAGRGHVGGSLSCVEILVALYHGGILRVDVGNPEWADRDRFIFSKGHSAESLYAVLADLGFFPLEELNRYGCPGSRLGGHVDRAVPGVEISTGSLGHGLGVGAGLALSARMDHREFLTVVLLGDGECYEGSVWEAAMFAAHHRLSNLVAIVDRNQQITLDWTEACNRLEPFEEKWTSFGWEVRAADGHSFVELFDAMENVRTRHSGSPLVVIARTTKGKGVSFMEGAVGWHHNVPKGEQQAIAARELGVHG